MSRLYSEILGREGVGQREGRRGDKRYEVTNSSIDVSVAFAKSNLDGFLNFMGFRLPCSKTERWDLVARVEGVKLPRSRRLLELCFQDQLRGPVKQLS